MEISYALCLIVILLFGLILGFIFGKVYYELKIEDFCNHIKPLNTKDIEQAYRQRLKMLESEKEAILTYLGDSKC